MKIEVVKIGGNVVENEELLQNFASDFTSLGGNMILVHGGGVMASGLQKRLGIEPVMIAGRRVTDARTLEIVTMVYAGWCNKHVTATLQKYGCNALGLCGADGKAILAARRPPVKVALTGEAEIREVDYGFAGDISPEGVNVPLFESFLNRKIMPVLCAITYDGNGNLLNTNADSVASAVAEALAGAGHETVLTYCFEKKGVLEDKNDPDSVIPEIKIRRTRRGRDDTQTRQRFQGTRKRSVKSSDQECDGSGEPDRNLHHHVHREQHSGPDGRTFRIRSGKRKIRNSMRAKRWTRRKNTYMNLSGC